MVRKLGSYKDNDVELCWTTNNRVSNEAVQVLVEEQIPFTRNRRRIPFFKREKYKGARQMWIITINPRRYGQARRVLDTMEPVYKTRMVFSNY